MTKLDEYIQVKIDPDTKAELVRAADEDGETVSIVLRRLVRDYLRGRVFLTTVPTSGKAHEEVAA